CPRLASNFCLANKFVCGKIINALSFVFNLKVSFWRFPRVFPRQNSRSGGWGLQVLPKRGGKESRVSGS
ncbi:hypothetical protein, partial [Treponema zioleckii]|uniref:hypothetical protein n=1 Tax=Treponema zioleckii TaxID=331680 RepID=UPI001A92437A